MWVFRPWPSRSSQGMVVPGHRMEVPKCPIYRLRSSPNIGDGRIVRLSQLVEQ
jgi:hypothetical protein